MSKRKIYSRLWLGDWQLDEKDKKRLEEWLYGERNTGNKAKSK